MANGNANNAVGNDPRLKPIDWNYQVNRMVNMVPKAMMSPWAEAVRIPIPVELS